jgi:predicted TIM-barrel fold metal-dependent hydrolase
MLSGLFDRYPTLQVILGHLGEGLPFMLPRLQHRIDEQREGIKGSKAKRWPSYYFANNFYITTSGHFHTKPFLEEVEQIGVDRVLFSADYPYEQMDMGARWFDDMRLDSATKLKVGRENANRLFSLDLPSLSEAAVSGFAS